MVLHGEHQKDVICYFSPAPSSTTRPLLGTHISNATLLDQRECKEQQPVFIRTIMTGRQASRPC